MFGLITGEPETEVGWGALRRNARFARRVLDTRAQRSFREVDWGALITASANLTAGVITAVAKGTQANSASQYPTSYQCPQGYYFDASVGQCIAPQQGGGIGIDGTTIAIGVGALALILLGGRS